VCQTPTRCCGPLVSVEPARAPTQRAAQSVFIRAAVPIEARARCTSTGWLGFRGLGPTSRRHKARSLITWLYVSATKCANRLIERYCLEELVLAPHEPEVLVLGSP
jgi:hypothetical protein